MPDFVLDDNTGAMSFDLTSLAKELSIDDAIKEEGGTKKGEEKVEGLNQELVTRINSLEQNNTKLQGLLSSLVSVLSQEEDSDNKKTDVDITEKLDLDGAFDEPDKVKNLVSIITQTVTNQVLSAIDKKISPSLKVLDNLNNREQTQQKIIADFENARGKHLDFGNFLLGMRYLGNMGVQTDSVEGLYTIAKNLKLDNSRFEGKQTGSNVKKFPSKLESSGIDITTEEKKPKTRKEIIAATMAELAEMTG